MPGISKVAKVSEGAEDYFQGICPCSFFDCSMSWHGSIMSLFASSACAYLDLPTYSSLLGKCTNRKRQQGRKGIVLEVPGTGARYPSALPNSQNPFSPASDPVAALTKHGSQTLKHLKQQGLRSVSWASKTMKDLPYLVVMYGIC